MRTHARVVLIVLVAAIGVAGLVRSRDGSAADRRPVAQIASFSAVPSATSLPDAAARKRFVTAFSEGGSIIGTLDLRHLRRFALAGPSDFSLVAAPNATGGICYLDSKGGGTCIGAFAHGAGMTEGYRKVDGVKHDVITGLVPDGFSKIVFTSDRGSHSASIHDNVFQYVIPASDGSTIRSYTLTGSGGSLRSEVTGL